MIDTHICSKQICRTVSVYTVLSNNKTNNIFFNSVSCIVEIDSADFFNLGIFNFFS